MILHALNSYFSRMNENMPIPGFSLQDISFSLILNQDGNLLNENEISCKKKQKNTIKLIPKKMIVPTTKEGKRSGKSPPPYFLWDNTKYVLGATIEKNGKDKLFIETPERFASFKKLLHKIGDSLKDDGILAVLRFIELWQPSCSVSLPYWNEMINSSIIFRLDGKHQYVHESPVVREAWLKYYYDSSSKYQSSCLITNKYAPIAQTHPPIKGVENANKQEQTSSHSIRMLSSHIIKNKASMLRSVKKLHSIIPLL